MLARVLRVALILLAVGLGTSFFGLCLAGMAHH
jgi:hypothetical protein